MSFYFVFNIHTHTHTRLTALFLGLPRWASTRKVKPIWILLKQETVSGSGISWDICKSAPHSRQITTPAPHHSVFYKPDALPAAQPTGSKHWRQIILQRVINDNSNNNAKDNNNNTLLVNNISNHKLRHKQSVVGMQLYGVYDLRNKMNFI